MTTAIGKQFEEEVARLLELSEFDVQREQILGHKKVDLYLLQRRFGSVRRIAVECKNYDRRLTQSELNSIYVNYLPLQRSNLIDEILVATDQGLSPSAETMAKQTRELEHMTRSQVFDLVLDLRKYLRDLIVQFDEDGLASYYVPPKLSGGEDLERTVFNWISGPSGKPVAILGSYGTGKTTFAKRLAHVLAQKTILSYKERIPIFIKLGEIPSEQSLEGLLGKIFTARSVVRNYTFDIFMALNRMGRFVILLDGFDEMKHTLSWGEFRYNFRQLNRLVTNNSRVILLGRPTAFLNDSEHRHALKGLIYVNNVEIKDPEWPEYDEIDLEPFTGDQVRKFLERYLKYKLSVTDDESERREIEAVISDRVDLVTDPKLAELSRRPVQLKMLAEVLPSWKGKFENFTVPVLYDYFINVIIERGQDKIARQQFDTKQRRQFAKELALFLWSKKREMSVVADDIPVSILEKFLHSSGDVEGARRDLVSACFLDRRLGNSLCFPHRSFQEYLVAESLIEELAGGQMAFDEANTLTNHEIACFIEDMIDLDGLVSWERQLELFRGTLSRRFAQIFLSRREYAPYLLERFKKTRSPWYPVLLTLAAEDQILERELISKPPSLFLERMDESDGQYNLVCFWCVRGLKSGIGNDRAAMAKLLKTKKYLGDSFHQRKSFNPEPSIVDSVRAIEISHEDKLLNMQPMYELMNRSLRRYCLVADRTTGRTLTPVDFGASMQMEYPEMSEIQVFQYTYCGYSALGNTVASFSTLDLAPRLLKRSE